MLYIRDSIYKYMSSFTECRGFFRSELYPLQAATENIYKIFGWGFFEGGIFAKVARLQHKLSEYSVKNHGMPYEFNYLTRLLIEMSSEIRHHFGDTSRESLYADTLDTYASKYQVYIDMCPRDSGYQRDCHLSREIMTNGFTGLSAYERFKQKCFNPFLVY